MTLARLRPPLLVTGLALALLLAGPSWLLLRNPRSHASGLERLAASAALLQSFRSGDLATPPPLWSQRLGPGLAQQLWLRPSLLWWQFWGGHGDGAEFLVLPAGAFGGVKPLPLPPKALQVDDLVVVAADPLNRQWLQDQLRLKFAPPQGQQRHCLNQLKSSEAVYWGGPTLGAVLGPLTPLFLPFQQGCFVLAGEGKALTWQGKASSLGPSPAGPGGRSAPLIEPTAFQGADALLLLQGGRLAPLVDGFIASRLVSEPLQKSYGLGPAQLGLLRQAPFELRLRSQAQGPYQASLELQLALGANASDWRALLAGLRKSLLAQGLEEKEASAQWQRQGMGDPFSASTWQRGNGTVVGGWRWLNRPPGRSQGASGQTQPRMLLVFLGPEPKLDQAGSTSLLTLDPAHRGTAGMLGLWAQPQALHRLGLLPQGIPPLLKRSRSLKIWARALDADGWSSGHGPSQLTGRLELP